MKVNKRIERLVEERLESIVDPKNLFTAAIHDMKNQYFNKSNDEFFDHVMNHMCSCGDIYRYCSLQSEHRLQCEDLRAQMSVIADTYKEFLGGNDLSNHDRTEKLYDLLHTARIQGGGEELEEAMPHELGFLPITEFSTPLVRVGTLLFPTKTDAFLKDIKVRIMALLICLLQILAPLMILLNTWYTIPSQNGGYGNFLLHPEQAWIKITTDPLCTSQLKSWKTLSTELIAVIILIMVIFILRQYMQDECDETWKQRLLPGGMYWRTLGSLVNAWCCICVILAAPLLFWTETDAVNLLLDCLSLLFLQSIDDMGEAIVKYLLELDDEKFSRHAMWTFALLASTPVNIDDVVNKNATSADEIFDIKFDGDKKLLKWTPEGKPLELCETRLRVSPHPQLTEKFPLLHQPVEYTASATASYTAGMLLEQLTGRQNSPESPRSLDRNSSSRVPQQNQKPTKEQKKEYHKELHSQGFNSCFIYSRSSTDTEVLPRPHILFLMFVWNILNWITFALHFILPVIYLFAIPCDTLYVTTSTR